MTNFFFIISLYSTKLSITQSFATASSVKYSEILQNFSYSIQSLSKTSPCTARKASPISQKSIWLMTITQSSMPWKRSKMMENCQMWCQTPHHISLASCLTQHTVSEKCSDFCWEVLWLIDLKIIKLSFTQLKHSKMIKNMPKSTSSVS